MALSNFLQSYREYLELGDGRHVELLDVLGTGGTTLVRRGLLTSKQGVVRPVAVKFYSPGSGDESDQLFTLLARSTRRVACVDHPNVVRVYDCGTWQGQPFLVSELVSGISLCALLEAYTKKQRRLPLDIALFIACEILEGLSAARLAKDYDGLRLGLVHHCLSAREVLLSWRGEVKISDFESSTLRSLTSSVRSFRYLASRAATMAPEVARGRPADERSDVFSYGVLLRELLVGPRFPSGITSVEAVRLAQEGYIQSMTFQPHLPPGLESVLSRALEISPEARYPNACAMAFDLRRIVLSMGVGDGRYFLRTMLEREWNGLVEGTSAPR